MQLKNIIVFALLLICLPVWVSGEALKQQGIGQVTYSGWGGPSVSVKQEAIEKAKKSALDKYTSTFSTSMMMNYEKIRAQVEGDIGRFITDYTVVDDDTDKDMKRYSVVIEANINTSLLDVELQKVSMVQNTSADDRSYMSFVFVAREVTSRKSFDARRSKRTVEESAVEEREESSAKGEQLEFSGEARKDSVVTTGGSTTQKSDQFEWDVSSSGEINTAMTGIFSTAGYEVVNAADLYEETDGLVNLEDFKEDYRYGDDISGETRRNAVKGCKSVDIGYLAIGTLDIGAKDIDPASGLTRVYVTVKGEVLDLSKRFPKTVAAIGPVQYAGLGTDQRVAASNALLIAGETAAKDLTAKLQAKGIK